MSISYILTMRLGDVDRDIALAMIFLANEDSRFITGQIIPVNGGLVATR